MPINSSNGEQFTEPEDGEIGTLNFMVATGLIVVDTSDHDRIHQFKEARSTLAHLNILNIEEVISILES